MRDSKIIDVAQKAQVSSATVSRVLNESPLVTEKTRRKVLQAIRELNYTPNAMGKQLRSRKTMTLGVVVTDIRVSYNAEIIKGIENSANRLGYKILICDAQNEKDKELEYLSLLQNRTADGMILVAPQLPDGEITVLADAGYSLGVIGRRLEHADIPCAFTDNREIGRTVVRHLVENGHRMIACLCGYANAPDSRERLEGYREGLAEAGLPYQPQLTGNGDFCEEGGYEAFKRLYAEPSGFTAVFTANDEMALGVYKACAELGLNIPDAMAVVGVDNIRLTHYVEPKISSVEQPLYEMGVRLAERLIDRMNGNVSSGHRLIELKSTLVVKGSSKRRPEDPD
ncbi:LacI family DNA-binding transcriptional regulator [Paenibacillus sp. S150]|uniref:LacI family DNA-binding transcriptional regulator n=1 Tax=Paenibacillus sp. S150 TaxID=2749826 RepID=UPI001C592841|nr:LacI family DNA-binding transcriptional regulator [Paenibacillus sp. S150]MBW4082695.1 LacI family DNA-binding transcriptional regulator [Paenibacillus sp. S150]